jgi:hypothetical protein
MVPAGRTPSARQLPAPNPALNPRRPVRTLAGQMDLFGAPVRPVIVPQACEVVCPAPAVEEQPDARLYKALDYARQAQRAPTQTIARGLQRERDRLVSEMGEAERARFYELEGGRRREVRAALEGGAVAKARELMTGAAAAEVLPAPVADAVPSMDEIRAMADAALARVAEAKPVLAQMAAEDAKRERKRKREAAEPRARKRFQVWEAFESSDGRGWSWGRLGARELFTDDRNAREKARQLASRRRPRAFAVGDALHDDAFSFLAQYDPRTKRVEVAEIEGRPNTYPVPRPIAGEPKNRRLLCTRTDLAARGQWQDLARDLVSLLRGNGAEWEAEPVLDLKYASNALYDDSWDAWAERTAKEAAAWVRLGVGPKFPRALVRPVAEALDKLSEAGAAFVRHPRQAVDERKQRVALEPACKAVRRAQDKAADLASKPPKLAKAKAPRAPRSKAGAVPSSVAAVFSAPVVGPAPSGGRSDPNYVGEALPAWVVPGLRLRVKTTSRIGTVREKPTAGRWWYEVEFPSGHVESLANASNLDDYTRELDKIEKAPRKKPPFKYWLSIQTPDYYQGGALAERWARAFDTRREALEGLADQRLIWADTNGSVAVLERVGSQYPKAGQWRGGGEGRGGWNEDGRGWQLFPGHPEW